VADQILVPFLRIDGSYLSLAAANCIEHQTAEIEALKIKVAQVVRNAQQLRCAEHALDASNAWGCPGCLVELRMQAEAQVETRRQAKDHIDDLTSDLSALIDQRTSLCDMVAAVLVWAAKTRKERDACREAEAIHLCKIESLEGQLRSVAQMQAQSEADNERLREALERSVSILRDYRARIVAWHEDPSAGTSQAIDIFNDFLDATDRLDQREKEAGT
jgi:chromosome segregation ATPase